MKEELYVIITAAGSGTRMGNTLAKQFITIKDKPILLRTIQLFKNIQEDAHIIIVLPNEYKEYWKEYCVKNNIWFRHTIVSGGITRFHSVKNALKHVPDNCVVAIHDGVRPFVPNKMLKKLINFKFDHKRNIYGVVPVMPLIESIREKKYDDNGKLTGTSPANRDNFISVQTPQVFSSTELRKCYDKPYSPLYTDDASVLENNGYNVDTTEGSRFNIKITTPEDLLMAEIFIDLYDNE